MYFLGQRYSPRCPFYNYIDNGVLRLLWRLARWLSERCGELNRVTVVHPDLLAKSGGQDNMDSVRR